MRTGVTPIFTVFIITTFQICLSSCKQIFVCVWVIGWCVNIISMSKCLNRKTPRHCTKNKTYTLHMIEMQRTALTLFDHDPGYAGNNHWADPTGVSSHCKVCKPPGIC